MNRSVSGVLLAALFGFSALLPAQASAEAINFGNAGRGLDLVQASAPASFAASVYSGSADMANLVTPTDSTTALWSGLPGILFPIITWRPGQGGGFPGIIFPPRPGPRPVSVSEPSTLLMMGIGFLGFANLARRRLRAGTAL